ncbi:argininosuccinate synthase [Paenibacillus ginsengihumi]|uniref:argininosuccinate synthase n=1 Tax=Paenibacillus ginsengihumi TaxID=431596 RepID=UPI00036EF9DD|nr:argininosuccinate synthase [Paenibacillus ginsengihumi]
MAKQKIVLAYSGGLDTSIILKWLKETYDAEIIAFTADIGQKEELNGLEEKALATGASKIYIDDLREEFARDFIFPMFQAGALYEGQYLLGTSIARPLIAKRMVDIARAEGATAIAHGATGKGNDQVRFELTAAALAPEINVIAPWRLDEFREQFPGRAEMIAYAEKHGIPVQASAAKPYSMDRNLLHISFESGMLEDPWFDASAPSNKDMYVLSVDPEDAPDQAEYVELEFEKGECVGVNGDRMSPLQVMEKLNELGGKHGIGRVDMVENRFVGMKSRGVYETPGGTILFTAHRKMESLTMDREVMHLRDSLIPRYASLVYNGFWFAPERLALQALVTESQKNVTGTVRLKLYKGNVIGAGVKSPVSLYNPDIATMEADPTQAYNQGDATGFIRLNALRLRVGSGVQQNAQR